MAETKKTVKAKKEAELIVDTAATDPTPETKVDAPKTEDKKLAKAGKRSAKATKETEEKIEKEARKTQAPVENSKPKEIVHKAPRTRLERAGKKYQQAAKQIDSSNQYTLEQALELATKTSPTSFDATVEMHINLNVDPTQADQNVRGTALLPAGSGKTKKVAVYADGDDAEKAKKAGADVTGTETIKSQLDKQQIEFDILITTPGSMAALAKYARLLGPRGLMPNPKSGTITSDIVKATTEAKAGKVEYRVDQSGIIHLGIGKVSFGGDKLAQNAETVISSVRSAKPSSIKGAYMKSMHISTSMGPSIKVAI